MRFFENAFDAGKQAHFMQNHDSKSILTEVLLKTELHSYFEVINDEALSSTYGVFLLTHSVDKRSKPRALIKKKNSVKILKK